MSVKIVNSKKKPQEVCKLFSDFAVKKKIGTIENQKQYYLDGKWDFLPDNKDEFYQIKVPSSWNLIEQFDHPENFKDVNTAWYHYAFDVAELSACDDLFLYFGAVSTVCNVYLNGNLLGYHGGRYTPFSFNINDSVKVGVNHLLVSVGDMSHALVNDGKGLVHQVGLMTLNGHMPDPFMPDHNDFGGIVREVYVYSSPKIRAQKVRIATSVKNKEIKVDFALTVSLKQEDIQIEIENLKGEKVALAFSWDITSEHATAVAKWENPNLWSPASPNLYYLTVKVLNKVSQKIRFGFREIEIDGASIKLNGNAIRLFGESLNLSNHLLLSGNRKEYSKLLFQTLKKEVNINCLRVHSMVGPKNMIDAADEVGMLILSQSGLWSSAGQYYNNAKEELLTNVKSEFEEWIWRDLNSPSIIVWDAENELMRGSRANDWPMQLDGIIQKIDTTRPIVHSGSGGLWKKCSMYHLHHNEHYQYIAEKWQGDQDKPLMIGEWWIGGRAGTPRNITGLDNKLYSIFEETKARLYYERIVELRNFGVSGVMPYSFLNYLFYPIFDYRQRVEFTSDNMEPCPDFLTAYSDSVGLGKELVNPNWDTSRPKYIMSNTVKNAFKDGFAPLASFVKNRSKYFKAGLQTKTLSVFNDTEFEQDVQIEVNLVYTLESETQIFTKHLKQGEQLLFDVSFVLPNVTVDTAVDIEVITKQHSIEIHKDTTSHIIMVDKTVKLPSKVALYDIAGKTSKVLDYVGADYTIIKKEELDTIEMSDYKLLIVGAYSIDDYVNKNNESLEKFVKKGSKIWVMEQEKVGEVINYPLSLISAIAQTTADFYDIGQHEPLHGGLNYSKYLPIYDPKHPIFADIGKSVSFFDNNDNRVLDNVYAKPLIVCNSVRNMKVLAGGTKQEHCSAMEFFEGDGLYLFTQFKLSDNAIKDPMAKRLLQNILSYLAQDGKLQSQKIQVLGSATLERLLKKNSEVYIDFSDCSLSDIIIVGEEIDYTSQIEEQFADFVKNGGTLLLSARNKESDFYVFGNHIVSEKDYHSNSIYFHNEEKIVSGMYGTDFELDGVTRKFTDKRDENFPVHYTLRINDVYDESNPINANTWYPLAELVYKNKTFWWYNAPKANNGYAAIEVKSGKGRVVLWQIDLAYDTNFSCFLTGTLLSNLSVELETPSTQTDTMQIIYLNDLEIDTDLSKWICDMEDDNVTRYRHAQSILMMTQHLSVGTIYSNVQCSGLVYFMYDKKYLYCLAQVVENHCVADGKSTGVNLILDGKDCQIRLNNGEDLSVKVAGKEIGSLCQSKWKIVSQDEFASNIDASRICAGILEPYYSGYILEIAIPFKEIDETLQTKKMFGVDAQLYHTNEDASTSVLKYSHNKKNEFFASLEF